MALDRLRSEEFELTQQQVADAVGKIPSERWRTSLRLLNLTPPSASDAACNGDLEMGHARALLSARRRSARKALRQRGGSQQAVCRFGQTEAPGPRQTTEARPNGRPCGRNRRKTRTPARLEQTI